MNKKFLIILFLLFVVYLRSFSQITLYGVVEHENNDSPIPYAMVFLSNTSQGTVSDSLGKFTLILNEGKHELIIKSLGFETLNYQFEHSDIQNRLYKFKLTSDDLELSTLKVESTRDKAWYDNLEIFKIYFLGQSINAKKSKLINPTILILDDQSIPSTLLARANRDLIIENQNLGYTIRYLLQTFEYSKREKKIYYSGYSYFTEMDGLSKRKVNQIKKNRMKAYEGSSMHFLRAVYNNTVDQEGFVVRRIRKIPNNNRPSEETLDSMVQVLQSGKPTELTFEEYARLKNLPKKVDHLEKEPQDLNQFITHEENGKKVLTFENKIQVIYTKAKPDPNYLAFQNPKNQKSLIHFLQGGIEIYENGSFSPTFDLFFEGYMGWLKTGDLLPMDYKIP